jgi:hypothetical protein
MNRSDHARHERLVSAAAFTYLLPKAAKGALLFAVMLLALAMVVATFSLAVLRQLGA